ncbi:MAG: manganese efflux pump [Clostridia bacterium]|nr:manganese efflux pump [Clostridia bacterium]
MGVWEVLLLGLAVSMDASAVAMTNGMIHSKMKVGKVLLIGLFFGAFQFLMPVIGYFITGIVANAFLQAFEKISAFVSFGLLAFLGGRMLHEGIESCLRAKNTDGCENCETVGVCTRLTPEKQGLGLGNLCIQAVATSIDALAVGVSLMMEKISRGLVLGVWGTTGVIGVCTLTLSVIAVYIGKAMGDKLADKAEIFGGGVLFAIGLKILIESFL